MSQTDYQVLVIGGGIHGVGVLHDLASRGISGVHLVEKKFLAAGTSSRSTKMLHGGLRYLEHISQWPLVREALQERTLLTKLLPTITRPLPFVLPCEKGGRPPWMIRFGLFLYDSFAGRSNLPRARKLREGEIQTLAPYLPKERVERDYQNAFLYYDGQMHDDAIVRLVAAAATSMGATFEEQTEATEVTPIENGFRVTLLCNGVSKTVTTRRIVNAAGSWVTANLLKWGFNPTVVSLLNVGSHLILKPDAVNGDPHKTAGTLFQNTDGRVVFFIPWFGKWLFGTTESILRGHPSQLTPPQQDTEYLLRVAERCMEIKNIDQHREEIFTGIRMMPLKKSSLGLNAIPQAWREDPFSSPFYEREFKKSISSLSRETILDRSVPNMISMYGGKFTTYRAECEKVGDILSDDLQRYKKTATHRIEAWHLEEVLAKYPDMLQTRQTLRHMGG
jgi:glycerol-3-phosphate dehydrogenase